MARLNDTDSLTRRAADGMEHSVSVKKIDNGFLTRISECNPSTGSYSSRESFSKEAPKIQLPKMGGEDVAGGGSLRDTMAYLKN